jgi:predicted esterase
VNASDPHRGQPVQSSGAPIEQSDGVALLVHGRGATPEDILLLGRAFQRPNFAYLAPAAAGQTWYPHSFLTEIAQNEPYLSSALALLDALVADLHERGIDRKRLVLIGFSQGACLCSEFAVRHADRYGGLIAFSGGLIGPPGTHWDYPGAFDGMPAFFGCSDVDPHIPAERVGESASVFRRMGADVTMRLYRGMGHTVNNDEMDEARRVLDAVSP